MSTKYRRHVVHNDLHQVIPTKFTQMTLGMPYYDVLVLVTFHCIGENLKGDFYIRVDTWYDTYSSQKKEI